MNDVVTQWGRFIYWLGQNAPAVQGFTAIITVVLTIVLIAVTIQYVKLTRGILEASEASMRSSFLPDLDGRIEVDSARRDQLYISVANGGLPPFRIVRAKVVDGIVHQWSDPPNQGGSYKAEAQFRGGALPELANRFLRKEERAGTMFKMVPVQPMEEGDWLNFQKRSSLTATVVVEVSDISGRVFYSFRIMRRAVTGSTRIETSLPSVFDSF